MGRKWTVDEDYLGRTTIEEEDNSDGSFFVFVILSLIISVLGVIVAVIGTFVLVGVLYGTFTGIKNYVNGIRCHSLHVGKTFIYTWNANEQRMHNFFDDAVKYDRNHEKHGMLVKAFYITSGLGVFLIGTILLPVFFVIHSVISFFVIGTRGIFGIDKNNVLKSEDDELKFLEQTNHSSDWNIKSESQVKQKTL